VLRFADAEVAPYNFSGLAAAIAKYVDQLKTIVKSMREEIAERNLQIEEDVFMATADPREPLVPPRIEQPPPYLNFAPLENGAAMLKRSASRYSRALARFSDSTRTAPALLNRKLIQSERVLTSNDGLPGRPWFRHQVYAPGFYTGYGVKTLPGVREAIEQKQWGDATEQILRVGKILENESTLIDSAAADLEKSVR
jgi:N-acetylated-alpha-linked acidic dipeptidase